MDEELKKKFDEIDRKLDFIVDFFRELSDKSPDEVQVEPWAE